MSYDKDQVFECKCRRCNMLNVFLLDDESTVLQFVTIYQSTPVWHKCEICRGQTFQDLTFCGTQSEFDRMPRIKWDAKQYLNIK